MGDVSLSITQKDPTAEINSEQSTAQILLDLGLIGQQVDYYGEVSYLPGKNFRDLIETEIGKEESERKKGLLSRVFSSGKASSPFTITLDSSTETGFDCSPEDLEIVQCSNCRTAINEWETEIDNWFKDHSYHRICPECGTSSPPYQFDFDRLGAVHRQRISITNIGKGYGHPTDKFLKALQDRTGTEFDYYFVRI